MIDQILDVPLADIEAPEGWNSRGPGFEEDQADLASDDGGYEGLEASMLREGKNLSPVLLCPKPDVRHDKKTGCILTPRYLLVDGFRRLHVARKHAWPTIRATIEELSEFERRRRNLQAQTSHARLKTADLAWGIADLKRLGGPALTNQDIGEQLGINSHYAGTLLRIMTEVDPKVTGAWRASAVKVNVHELQRLTALPKEKHWAEWQTIVLESQTRPTARGKFTDELRLERRALELGKTVGALDRLGVADRQGDWALAIPHLTKRQLTEDQRKKICDIIEKGYQEGLSGKDK